MTIIFYNTEENCLHICSDKEKMIKVNIKTENIQDFIPNDDILYVENAHYINKKQFCSWLKGDYELNSSDEIANRFLGSMDDSNNFTVRVQDKKHNQISDPEPQISNKKYIHPSMNGSVIISDISTDKYPNGVVFESKWDFKDVDEFGGEEELMKSNIYRHLIKNKKLEIVAQEYLVKNKNKIANNSASKNSIVEKNLNKILLAPHVKAKDAASGDHDYSQNSAIEFVID